MSGSNTTGPQAAQAVLDAIVRLCESGGTAKADVIVAILEKPASLSALHAIAHKQEKG